MFSVYLISHLTKLISGEIKSKPCATFSAQLIYSCYYWWHCSSPAPHPNFYDRRAADLQLLYLMISRTVISSCVHALSVPSRWFCPIWDEMSNALFVNGLEILGSIFCWCFDFFFSFTFDLIFGMMECPVSLTLFGAFTFCHSHRTLGTLGGSRRLSNAVCTSSNHLDLQPLLCPYLTTDMVLTNFVRKSCSVIWSISCCVFTKQCPNHLSSPVCMTNTKSV